MATLSPTGLQTATYGTTGWNNIYSTNFQMINDFFNKFNLSLNQITFSSNITVDWSKSDSQMVTLTGNTTINFTNGRAGGKCILLIKQDSTGGRTVTWGSNVVNGLQPSTTANSLTAMIFIYDSVDSKYIGLSSPTVVNNTITVNVGIINASTTLTQSNSGSVIELNTLSANATVTLPAVSAGFYVTFMGNNGSSYSYTLQPPSGANIFWNGVWSSSVVLNGPLKGGMYYLFCDGYNYVLSYYPNFVGAPINNPSFTGTVSIPSGSFLAINATSPTFPLQVNANVLFGTPPAGTYYSIAPLNLSNNGAGIKTQLNLINGYGGVGTGSAIDFYTYTDQSTSSGPGARIAGVDDGKFSGNIQFFTKDGGVAGGAITPKITLIGATGYSGFGTATPSERVDVNGNIQASGAIKCNLVATLAGTTAGSIQYSMYLQGRFKAIGMQAIGYENNTSTDQTITFPVAFTNTPVIVTNTTGLTLSVSTTALTITAPNSTTTFSGIIEIKGF